LIRRRSASSVERSRNAALKRSATDGTRRRHSARGRCRGVSVGLVQHHFVTKAGLVNAVDDKVPGTRDRGRSRPPSRSLLRRRSPKLGSRLTRLSPLTHNRRHLGRALTTAIHWERRSSTPWRALGMGPFNNRKHERGETRARSRPVTNVGRLNALVLPLGTLIRPPRPKKGPYRAPTLSPFTTPPARTVARRRSIQLLREGLFRNDRRLSSCRDPSNPRSAHLLAIRHFGLSANCAKASLERADAV